MTQDRPGVVVVDDHQLLAQSLALALGTEGVDCTVPRVQDFETTDALVARVAEERPELVLLDLDLGDRLYDGSELVTPLVLTGARVLVVSASTDEDMVARALENGAMGVLDKAVPFTDLLRTVRDAARGHEVFSPVERMRLIDAARRRRVERAEDLGAFDRLSPREAQVLRQLAEGRSVATIAVAWFVSEATVRTQVRAVLAKLGAASQLEAVALARRTGWLDRP